MLRGQQRGEEEVRLKKRVILEMLGPGLEALFLGWARLGWSGREEWRVVLPMLSLLDNTKYNA